MPGLRGVDEESGTPTGATAPKSPSLSPSREPIVGVGRRRRSTRKSRRKTRKMSKRRKTRKH